ncbi:MAG: ribosome silencing factor [Wenzhouxiangellaceae bacterium]|nr:ribosome silencing factor [Wenzhouxiangellaceae bacterium]
MNDSTMMPDADGPETLRQDAIEPARLRDLVVGTLDDAKAEDIQVFDLSERNTFADFMIVASGTSTRHNRALAERLGEALKVNRLPRPLGVEGEDPGEWVLVDLTDVVVHLMLPQTRAFYNLEKLWQQSTLTRASRTAEEPG